jgi:hypothetical protein
MSFLRGTVRNHNLHLAVVRSWLFFSLIKNCNSDQTFRRMVFRCRTSRTIYWLRYQASQLSAFWFTCLPTCRSSYMFPVLWAALLLCSVQNAWQSFVAYDACFRLCLNAWAKNCMEAPEFLRDECMVLRSAFGYATTHAWIIFMCNQTYVTWP